MMFQGQAFVKFRDFSLRCARLARVPWDRDPQASGIDLRPRLNNRFGEAVFRFAQFIHDSDAEVTPILFTRESVRLWL
jgi:hypothetical protein